MAGLSTLMAVCCIAVSLAWGPSRCTSEASAFATRSWAGSALVLAGAAAALAVLRQDPAVALLDYDSILLALGCLWAACRAARGRTMSPPMLFGAPLVWTALCAVRPVVSHPDLRLGLACLAGIVPLGGAMLDLRRSRIPSGREPSDGSKTSTPRIDDVRLGDARSYHEALAAAFDEARRTRTDIALIVVGYPAIDPDTGLTIGRDPGRFDPGRLERILRDALYRPVDRAFRIAEDDVVILLPGTGGLSAAIVAGRIERGLSQAGGGTARLSLGLAAMRPTPSDDIASLIGRAHRSRQPVGPDTPAR